MLNSIVSWALNLRVLVVAAALVTVPLENSLNRLPMEAKIVTDGSAELFGTEFMTGK